MSDPLLNANAAPAGAVLWLQMIQEHERAGNSPRHSGRLHGRLTRALGRSKSRKRVYLPPGGAARKKEPAPACPDSLQGPVRPTHLALLFHTAARSGGLRKGSAYADREAALTNAQSQSPPPMWDIMTRSDTDSHSPSR